MTTHLRSLAVGVIAVAVLAATASPASASPYSKSPPSFDGLTMLRVAAGYNLTKVYDLSFPAKSNQACEIAGVGTFGWVIGDHGVWANENKAALDAVYDEALAATGGGHLLPCYMLRSESLGKLVSGLPRVWPATLKPNFNQLRKALKRGDCREAEKRLRKYPPVGLPRPRIRSVLSAAAGGSCERR